jgi:hypothetical protein
MGELTMITALKVFKYAFSGLRAHLGEILKSLPDLPVDPKTRAFIAQLLGYIIQVSGDAKAEDLEEELRSFESELSKEVLMTIEEQLIERGTIRDKKQVLLRLVEKKFGPLDDDTKQEILDTNDRDKLDSAIDLILDADSVEEVLSPLK